ncbi:hypothetical protein HPC49_49550, partial [Pyxidicoccus fallax]|uniref:hypothetical protein n=1 Tax=Pyxidicoccus fallax TaxID=394095 RepID=UPI001494E09A
GGDDAPPPAPVPAPTEKPLATLRGQLATEPGAELTGPVRLALAWYPGMLSEESGPVSKPLGIVTEDIAYSGGFPASYTFDVKSAPPAEALVQLGNGMHGKGAMGILLAYNDRDGNGALDTIPADGTPVDRVLGASLAWTRPPAFVVVYLDSAQPAGTGLTQGFNLVRLDDNHSSGVVPLTTPIPLSLHDDPLLDVFVCEAAWDDTSDQAPCGLLGEQPVEGVLTLGGELVVNGDSADVTLEVRRDGASVEAAQVTVGDEVATYDATLDRYTLHLENASALLGAGLVTVMAKQGDEAVARTVVVPSRFELLQPTAPMSYSPGETVHAAWTQSHGATDYEVSVVAGDEVLASGVTRERGLKLATEAYEGSAVVRVGVAVATEGFVVRRMREVPISFTPCDTVTDGSALTVEGEFIHSAGNTFTWESNEVRVEVKNDDVHVTDAKVMLSGFNVPYVQQVGAFHNVIIGMSTLLVDGSVELRVMRGNEVLCRTLKVPGDFNLTLHGEPERPTGSPLAVSWSKARDAVDYELLLGASGEFPLIRDSVRTNDLSYTFESVDIVGNAFLRFSAVAYPAHNDTLGRMDVKRLRTGGATFTGVTTAD